MGLVLIQPFFAVIGLSTTVGGLFGLGLPVLVYAFLMVGIQALAVLLVRCQQRWGWPVAWADRRWCCPLWRSAFWEC